MYVQPTTLTLDVSFVHYTVEARHQQRRRRRRRRNLAFLWWHYTDVFIIHHSTTIPHAYPHIYSSTHTRARTETMVAYSHRPRSPRRSALCKASIPVVCSNANVLDVLRVMMIVGGIVCVVPASSLTTSPSLPPAPSYLPCPYALTVGREMVSPARISHTIILSTHTHPPDRPHPHRRQTQAYKRTHAL